MVKPIVKRFFAVPIPGYKTEFDRELIETVLPHEIVERHSMLIGQWLSPNDWNALSRSSVKLHRVLTEHYLADRIDLVALSERYRLMCRFENHIKDVKVGLGDKFYRDHLAHVIRVTLLMIYLSREYFDITDDEMLSNLAVAGLFHDIAYPLQEHAKLVNIVSRSLETSYCSTVSTRCLTYLKDERQASEFVALLYEQIRKYRLVSRIPNESVVVSSLVYGLLTKNHGLLSAFELWNMLLPHQRTEKNMLSVLLGIALHDIELFPDDPSAMISLDKFPVLFILILSDDLQEWNRCVFEGDGISHFLSRLNLSRNGGIEIKGEYSIPDNSNFSPYLQLISKTDSLSRLKSDIPIRIEFSGIGAIFISSGSVGQRICADVTTKVLGDDFESISMAVRADSGNLLLEYAIQTYSEQQVLNHFAEECSLTQRELIFQIPLYLEGFGSYIDGSGGLYVKNGSHDMVLLLTKTKRESWPPEIRTYTFRIGELGINTELDGIPVLSSCIIVRGKEEEIVSKSAPEQRSVQGPIHFHKKLYHTDKIPSWNLSVVLTQ